MNLIWHSLSELLGAGAGWLLVGVAIVATAGLLVMLAVRRRSDG